MTASSLGHVAETIEKGVGYSLDFGFNSKELEQVRSYVSEQWIDNIKKVASNHRERFAEIGIANYHQLSHLLDHSAIWSKVNRILSQEVVDFIRGTSLCNALETLYGDFIVTDEENIGREEFYWRLVRPNEPADRGGLHADAWFWELGHGEEMPKNARRIKVWIALFCEPGLSGLRVVPDSHKLEWAYHGEYKHGFVKPQIDIDDNALPIELVKTKPGDAIVFHDRLLHGGALNQGKYTRVSLEFTIFVRQ